MEIRIENISRIIEKIGGLGLKVEPIDENLYIGKTNQTTINLKVSGANHYFMSFNISRELLQEPTINILLNNMQNIIMNMKIEYDAWDKRKNVNEEIPMLNQMNIDNYISESI